MPLPEEEMEKIDPDHQIRPYLLCYEEKDYFLAFPATSKAFEKKMRYENEKLLVNHYSYFKSLVNLSKLYILPKTNIRSEYSYMNSVYNDELIKKLQANTKYSNYPENFLNYINSLEFDYQHCDLVESDENLYLIVGKSENKADTFYCVKVFNHPVNNTYEFESDGLKFYVELSTDLKKLKKEDMKYLTKIYGLTIGSDVDNPDYKVEYYHNKNNIYFKKNLIKISNLPNGTIISYKEDDMVRKMIILEKKKESLNVIVGDQNQTYSEFELLNIPKTTNLEFKIDGTLTDDRLENLKLKKLDNNIKVYKYKIKGV